MNAAEGKHNLNRLPENAMPKRSARMKGETFEAQTLRTILPSFNAETARKLGEIAVNIAQRRGLPVAVSVVRPCSALYYCALEGSCADNGEWIRRKQNTVFHFGRSSLEVGELFAREGWTLSSHGLDAGDYTLFGGGVPLRVANAGVVGAMSVSGLDDVADHDLVIEALCWHLELSDIEGPRAHTALASERKSEQAHV